MTRRFIARPGGWFDAGTEASHDCDVIPGEAALFAGLRNGELDEEVCGYDEFDVIEEA